MKIAQAILLAIMVLFTAVGCDNKDIVHDDCIRQHLRGINWPCMTPEQRDAEGLALANAVTPGQAINIAEGRLVTVANPQGIQLSNHCRFEFESSCTFNTGTLKVIRKGGTFLVRLYDASPEVKVSGDDACPRSIGYSQKFCPSGALIDLSYEQLGWMILVSKYKVAEVAEDARREAKEKLLKEERRQKIISVLKVEEQDN
jgi:hypothetical protein